jgi:hypothetical protein
MTTMLTKTERMLLAKGESYDSHDPEHKRALNHLIMLGFGFKKVGKVFCSTKAGDTALLNQPPPLKPDTYYVLGADVENPTADKRSSDWNRMTVIKAGKTLYCDSHLALSSYSAGRYEHNGSELYCAMREHLTEKQLSPAQELRVQMGENLCYQHSFADYLPEVAEILFSRGQLRIEDVRKARLDLDMAAQEIMDRDGDTDDAMDVVLERDKLLKDRLPPIETLQGKVSKYDCDLCEDVGLVSDASGPIPHTIKCPKCKTLQGKVSNELVCPRCLGENSVENGGDCPTCNDD